MSTHVPLLEIVLSISPNATLIMCVCVCVCVSIRLDTILNTILLPVLLNTTEMSANVSQRYQNKQKCNGAVLLKSTAYIYNFRMKTPQSAGSPKSWSLWLKEFKVGERLTFKAKSRGAFSLKSPKPWSFLTSGAESRRAFDLKSPKSWSF